ncbi:MAG: hypothetical protein JKY15_07290 [Deltaproteobacteria bacterium]|nr:hypothetical protein [Deltaproteobacteria bacterium]
MGLRWNSDGGDFLGLATTIELNSPSSVDVDQNNNLLIADQGNEKVRKVFGSATAFGIDAIPIQSRPADGLDPTFFLKSLGLIEGYRISLGSINVDASRTFAALC